MPKKVREAKRSAPKKSPRRYVNIASARVKNAKRGYAHPNATKQPQARCAEKPAKPNVPKRGYTTAPRRNAPQRHPIFAVGVLSKPCKKDNIKH